MVAYALGKGVLPVATGLQEALREDMRADPLFFLASHSGKTFGEKYVPLISQFWLSKEGDGWAKKSSKDLYDVGWSPRELGGGEVRIELKASSEHPAYLFQQIRHPRLSGHAAPDYDVLLCCGVSAGSLTWWAIPASRFDEFVENGKTPQTSVVITRHHGKRRAIWNDECGYTDEGWFRADARSRLILDAFSCAASPDLREHILEMF